MSQVAKYRDEVVVKQVVQGSERRPAAFLAPSLVSGLQGRLQLAALSYAHPREGLRGLVHGVAQFDDRGGDGARAAVFQGEGIVRCAGGPQIEKLRVGESWESAAGAVVVL